MCSYVASMAQSLSEAELGRVALGMVVRRQRRAPELGITQPLSRHVAQLHPCLLQLSGCRRACPARGAHGAGVRGAKGVPEGVLGQEGQAMPPSSQRRVTLWLTFMATRGPNWQGQLRTGARQALFQGGVCSPFGQRLFGAGWAVGTRSRGWSRPGA